MLVCACAFNRLLRRVSHPRLAASDLLASGMPFFRGLGLCLETIGRFLFLVIPLSFFFDFLLGLFATAAGFFLTFPRLRGTLIAVS